MNALPSSSRARAVLCVAIGLATASCGGSSDSPSSPGSAGASPTTGGAGGSSNSSAAGSAQAGSQAAAGAQSQPQGGADSGTSGAGNAPSEAGSKATGGTGNAGGNSGNASAGKSSGGSSAGGSTGGSAASGGSTGAAGARNTGGAGNLPNLTVYIAGDSTVSQYVLDPNDPKSWAGWGQFLAPNFTTQVTVVDDAVGGRTALRFVQEGHLDDILKVIKAGDYLLVQFGTNDGTMGATYVINGVTYPYFAAAATDFKTNLQPYITGALAKQAIPVLVTPPPRNSAYCNGGRSLADYGQAMIEVGKAATVAVVDLGLKTHAYLSAICPKPTSAAQETFFKVTGGTIDGTHFQENGARVMAGFVADGIVEDQLGLGKYRK